MGQLFTGKLNPLKNVQVAAGRMITGLQKNSSRNALYSELEWKPLSIRTFNSIKLYMV